MSNQNQNNPGVQNEGSKQEIADRKAQKEQEEIEVIKKCVENCKGELYKCFESVGNRLEVIGDIRNYRETNGRLEKWLKYDPFADSECRDCVALPVCMGGCAHHAMDPKLYDNRCDTFRHSYHEQVLRFATLAEQDGLEGLATTSKLAARAEKAR